MDCGRETLTQAHFGRTFALNGHKVLKQHFLHIKAPYEVTYVGQGKHEKAVHFTGLASDFPVTLTSETVFHNMTML